MSDPIASLAAFLASQLAPLAGAKEPKTSDGCGPSSPEPLAFFGPDGSSPKTFQASLLSTGDEPSPKWSETFGGWVMWDSAYLYRLPTWAPPIAASESGSWPTPRTTDANGSAPHGEGGQAIYTTARDWATPTSRDHKDTGDLANVPENALLGRQAANFAPGQMPLLSAGPMAPCDSSPVTPSEVKEWQTPNGFQGEKWRQVGQTERAELLLPGEAKAWATPKVATGDYSYANGNRETPVQNLEGMSKTFAGQRAAYNPRFGLWLMGLPGDWLDAPVFEATKPRGGRVRKRATIAP